MGRIIDINGPNNTYDTETESTPVSGVDTKNAVVAPFEAPARLKPIAAGITPHEHKGIGAPIKAAFTVVKKPSLPKCLFKKFAGKYTFNNPAISKPSINQGADNKNNCQKLLSKSIDVLQGC